MTWIVFTLMLAADPAEIVLWPNGAPGSEGKSAPEAVRLNGDARERVVSSVHRPTLVAYPAAQPLGPAVIVAPGGGHRELWTDHEGHNVARWLAEHGVTAFVLKYRLAREKDSVYSVEGHALADTQRALRLVRLRAGEWKVDPEKIGVMGFSAGGELAALAAARPWDGQASAADAVDRVTAKPAFQALIYPAIPKEMPLTKETPRAFLACGENDRQNISQGLPELYLAMKKAGVPAELHVYAGVGHGFGVRPTAKGPAAAWLVRFHEWLLR
jgi:acetyl esterase/lipase